MSDDLHESLFVGREVELTLLEKHYKAGTRVIVVHGAAGSGKTSLARMFESKAQTIFPGGVLYKTAFYRDEIVSLIYKYYQYTNHILTKDILLIIDDADSLSDQDINDIRAALQRNPKLSLLLIAREPKNILMPEQFSLELHGLDRSDFMKLFLNHAAFAHDIGHGLIYKQIIEDLYDRLSGLPIFADIAGNSIRDGSLKWYQLLKAFGDFQCSGIVGPDGQAIASNIQAPESIIIDIKQTNAELLQKLQ